VGGHLPEPIVLPPQCTQMFRTPRLEREFSSWLISRRRNQVGLRTRKAPKIHLEIFPHSLRSSLYEVTLHCKQSTGSWRKEKVQSEPVGANITYQSSGNKSVVSGIRLTALYSNILEPKISHWFIVGNTNINIAHDMMV